MPPLIMDTRSESASSSSVSAEEDIPTGSETGGKVRRRADKRGKRREKNRNAARKSRKKQTERADELHEELQSLEHCNTALEKEIGELKRDLQRYTMALELHRPLCRLRASKSSPPAHVAPSAPLPMALQSCSDPSCLPFQTSYSTQDTNFLPSKKLSVPTSPAASFPHLGETLPSCLSPCSIPLPTSYSSSAAPPPLSTSLTSNLGLHILGTHLPPSSTGRTTNTSNSSFRLSTDILLSSSPSPHPSISSSMISPPQSLFGKGPPPLTSSGPTNAPLTPVYTSLVSNLLPSGQGTFHVSSSMSTNALFSQTNGGVLSASSHAVSTIPHLDLPDVLLTKKALRPYTSAPLTPLKAENVGLAAQGCPMNTPQLHPRHVSGTLNHSSPPYALLPLASEDPALQSLSAHSVPPQTNLDLAPAFAVKPSFSQQNTPNHTPLLSFLTVPSPFYAPQTTSSNFTVSTPGPSLSPSPLSQASPSLPPLDDPSTDLSLLELLEGNDWLLSSAPLRWDL